MSRSPTGEKRGPSQAADGEGGLVSSPWDIPLTSRGVAGIASHSWFHWWLWQAGMALVGGAACAWFFNVSMWPLLRNAADRLPPGLVGISRGRLEWPAGMAIQLAENAFLGLSVDPSNEGQFSLVSDLNLVLRDKELAIINSGRGFRVPYPAGLEIRLSRVQSLAACGAWHGALLIIIAGVTAAGLLLTWSLMALAYLPVLSLWKRMLRSQAGTGLVFRSISTALLGGAWWMIAALGLYGVQIVRLPGFLVVVILHWLAGFWLALRAVSRLPRQRPDRNPFH